MSSITAFFDQIKKTNAQFVDFRFTDMRGLWHHMSLASSNLTPELLEAGIYFDGSSIPGWCAIHKSDMTLIPDFSYIQEDQFSAQTTLIVICDVHDPVASAPYERDPRSIAKLAQAYLEKTGIADKAYFGPEAEFFIFDNVRFDTGQTTSFYELDSDEFPQSNAKPIEDGNHGHRPLSKGGYFPVSPLDSMSDLRAEMTSNLQEFGLTLERHHHEVAPAQHEIGIKYASFIESADHIQIYKYVVKNVAHSYGKTATFMPKPIYAENGSGMHVHQSLWKGNTPLFFGDGYAELSETALFYIGGILKHAKALNAFTNPTTNSYKRLVPGYEAPVILAYSARNRSAACRIPLSRGKSAKRIEIRFPDCTANAYLAFSAMLMAGLDGIKNRIHPGDAVDHNLYEEKEIAARLPNMCGSLREALESLEKDNDFLTAGGVFSLDFIKAYSDLKWAEVHAYDQAPHPIEFKMYYSS